MTHVSVRFGRHIMHYSIEIITSARSTQIQSLARNSIAVSWSRTLRLVNLFLERLRRPTRRRRTKSFFLRYERAWCLPADKKYNKSETNNNNNNDNKFIHKLYVYAVNLPIGGQHEVLNEQYKA